MTIIIPHQCLPSTWFLSVDFQLYIMTFVLIKLLIKRPKLTTWLFGLLSLVALVAPELMSHYLPSDTSPELVTIGGHQFVNYFASYTHLPSYLAGILIGYCHLKNKRPLRTVSNILTIFDHILNPSFRAFLADMAMGLVGRMSSLCSKYFHVYRNAT